MYIIGIDPGKTGGVAAIYPQANGAPHICPMFEHINGFVRWMEAMSHMPGGKVYIERAQAMPKNGAVSMFNYGVGYGELLGVLATLKIPFEAVSPSVWTKEMLKGVPANLEGKQRASCAVARLFPEVDLRATPRCKKPHEGMVDALLIAAWGQRRHFLGTQ